MKRRPKGYHTRIIGDRLDQLIRDEFPGLYRVHYDHKEVAPDRIIAYSDSEGVGNKLAYLDLAVVSLQADEEKLLIISEIEEHKHSPKRFLGDIAAIMIAESIRVRGHVYPLADVFIVLGLVLKGNQRATFRAERTVSRLESLMGGGKGGERGIECIVLHEKTGVELVERVVAKVRELMIERNRDTHPVSVSRTK